VDVRRGGALLVDGRKHDPAGAFAHLREGVLERLGGACCTHAAGISAEAAARREVLGAALTSAGLVN